MLCSDRPVLYQRLEERDSFLDDGALVQILHCLLDQAAILALKLVVKKAGDEVVEV